MAAERSIKQQYMDMFKGIPTDILIGPGLFPAPEPMRPSPAMWTGPGFMGACHGPEGGDDIFGVHYVTNRDTGYGALPEPGKFMFEDVTTWGDYVHAPNVDDYDWEQIAKEDDENAIKMGGSRERTARALNLHVGYFQQCVGFMGFENTLIAIEEEPESIKELCNYLCDFYCSVIERYIDYAKPDTMEIVDDTCMWNNPFMSPEKYRELYKPFQAREAQYAIDRGMPVTMHCCGKAEAFLDDWRDFNVQMWDPAQTCNDLEGVQAKYGANMMIAGGWDPVGRLVDPDISEEEFKEISMAQARKLAKAGVPFLFGGGIATDPDNVPNNNKNRWLMEIILGDFGLNLFK